MALNKYTQTLYDRIIQISGGVACAYDEINERKSKIVPDKNGMGIIVGLTIAKEIIEKYIFKHLEADLVKDLFERQAK
jgi:hypothetical protein